MEQNKSMDKSSFDSMRQQQGINTQPPNYTNRNFPNQNDRMMQDSINRMMQANKNVYSQFPSYGPYGSNPFGGMSQMHMAQFRNQMPFSMPPPGGIPYILQGYP